MKDVGWMSVGGGTTMTQVIEKIRQELLDTNIQILSVECLSFLPYNPRAWGSVATLVAAPHKAISNAEQFQDLEQCLGEFLNARIVRGYRETRMQYSLLACVHHVDDEAPRCNWHRMLVSICLYPRVWEVMPTGHEAFIPHSSTEDPFGLL